MAGLQINHPTGPGPQVDEPSWDTKTMQEEFEAIGFSSPYIVVKRRSDGVVGTLQFANTPDRVYWGFVPDAM